MSYIDRAELPDYFHAYGFFDFANFEALLILIVGNELPYKFTFQRNSRAQFVHVMCQLQYHEPHLLTALGILIDELQPGRPPSTADRVMPFMTHKELWQIRNLYPSVKLLYHAPPRGDYWADDEIVTRFSVRHINAPRIL